MVNRVKRWVLVVEDDADAGRMYQVLLRRWGYEAFWAKDGPEGLRIAQQLKPDLILMDVMLPQMTGYEVAQALREDPGFAETPIIFLTVLDGFDARSRAFNSGANDFLNKVKASHEELRTRIRSALQRVKRSQENRTSVDTGVVVGLLSFAGGTGVSTIALQLAAYAAQQGQRLVYFLDLSYPLGYADRRMQPQSTRHILELLAHSPEAMNSVMIGRYTRRHPMNFFFIPAPTRLTSDHRVNPQTFERLLQILKQDGHFVVVDLGKGVLPLQWDTWETFDWLCLITTLRDESCALTASALEELPRMGLERKRIRLVFNDVEGNAREYDLARLPRHPDVIIPKLSTEQQMAPHPDFDVLWRMVNYTQD